MHQEGSPVAAHILYRKGNHASHSLRAHLYKEHSPDASKNVHAQ